MKQLLFICIIFSGLSSFAQDTTKLQKIDSLVASINSSAYTITKDSVITEYAVVNMKIITYLTTVFDDAQLKKYVSEAHSVTRTDSTVQELITTNAFYFHREQLIKVEESGSAKGQTVLMNWYFEEEEPIYWTLDSENAANRAEFLLKLGKEIFNKLSKGK